MRGGFLLGKGMVGWDQETKIAFEGPEGITFDVRKTPEVYKSLIPAPFVVLLIYLAVALRGESLYGQLFDIRKMETDDWFTNNVTAIAQDFQGYIWLGTDNGLYRFDGRKAVRYPGSDFKITCLLESTDSTLWIGTTNGVRSLDKNRTSLKTFQQDINQVLHVRSIVEDRHNRIWAITYSGLVFTYTNSGSNEVIPSGTDSPFTLVNLAIDNRNNLWATTTDTGLVMMDRDGRVKEYHRLPYPADRLKSAGSDLIISSELHFHKFDTEKKTISMLASLPDRDARQFIITLFEYNPDGQLWVYRSGKELAHINTITGDYQDLNSTYAAAGPPHMEVNTLFLDKYGLLWLGTNAGLYTLATYEKQFNYLLLPQQDERRPYLSLRGIYQDGTRHLYFGSYRGFFRYNLSDGTFREILLSHHESEEKNPLVYAIAPDPLEDSILWLATEGNGLLKYNKRVGRITLAIPEQDYNSEQDALLKGVYWMFSVLPDEDRIWVGTSDGLYYCFRGAEAKFIRDDAIQKSNRVNVLMKASDSSMWIGTSNGLYLRTKLGTVEGVSALNGKTITALCITNNDLLWVGTRHSGLFRYNPATGETRHYGSLSGLPHEAIAGILRGGEDELWISTNNGLSRFNLATEVFANFYTNSGLTVNEFNTGSAFRANDGTLYFGTVNGINFFKPSEIVSWSVPPRILLTELRQHIGNRDTTIVRHFNIQATSAITLRHNDNLLALSFSADHYDQKNKIRLFYRIKQLDEDWHAMDASNTLQFASLPAGKYQLEVTTQGSTGNLNQGQLIIPIHVRQAYYKTPIAYSVYALLLVLALFTLFRLYYYRLNMKRKLAIEHEQSQRLMELNEIKSRLFTNIAHEFRTPLTLIKGPAQLIESESAEPQTRERAGMINGFTGKMLQLVNELLHIGRMEAGVETIDLSEGDIVLFIQNIAESFHSAAAENNIRIKFKSSHPEFTCIYDEEKLHKVAINLLSNAIKFTPPGGTIHISMQFQGDGSMVFIVRDEGIGITEAHLPHIFKRYYQAGKDSRGSGIGLALVKEIVDLLKGNIQVESQIGNGTTFTVSLPVVLPEAGKTELTDPLPERTIALTESPAEAEAIANRPVVLVVDDHRSVLDFTASCLGDECTVLKANDGEAGMEIAINHIPDLIVTDSMMPRMDGNEFSRKLKKNLLTSHIPVIMLTAKASEESRIESLTHGVDSYLTKPFSPVELRLMVRNLISLKREMQRKALENKDAPIQLPDSRDQQFYNEFLALADKHLDNSDLSADDLVVQLGISRTQLHRKLKGITGLSAMQLIRRIRLQKALEMLKRNDATVAEIGFRVGFTSPSHFAQSFRQQFGYPPSEVKR